MSGICAFNLKKHKMQFDELNDLAKEIVRYCLDHDLGATFNLPDGVEYLVEQEHMKNYFWLSDSFLYTQCDFLEIIPDVDREDWDNPKNAFTEKFAFFNDLLKIIFEHNVSEVSVLIDAWVTEDLEDFEVLSATPDNFSQVLFGAVKASAEDRYHLYVIPSLKITVEKK